MQKIMPLFVFFISLFISLNSFSFALKPQVQTLLDVSNVTATSMILKGFIQDTGTEDVDAGFIYGVVDKTTLQPVNGLKTVWIQNQKFGIGEVQMNINFNCAEETYAFSIIAKNSYQDDPNHSEPSEGGFHYFTSLSCSPTVITSKVSTSPNGPYEFLLNGEVTDIGGSNIIDRGFNVYDCNTLANYPTIYASAPTNGGQENYWSELDPNTYGIGAGIYCYKAWASNRNSPPVESDNFETFEIVCDNNGKNCQLKNETLSIKNLFPNQVKDFLQVESSQNISELQVINSAGAVVLQLFPDLVTNFRLDLSSLPAGFYSVRLMGTGQGNSIASKKFFKI